MVWLLRQRKVNPFGTRKSPKASSWTWRPFIIMIDRDSITQDKHPLPTSLKPRDRNQTRNSLKNSNFIWWKKPSFDTKNFSSHNSFTPQTPQFHTKNLSVQHTPQTKTVLNWGVFGMELRGVELRDVWNRGDFRVELRGFWVLKRCDPYMQTMCWTERCVWNWRVLI